ncbi:MAG: FkbM family methyltransferase [Pseudomonadota bacterium]
MDPDTTSSRSSAWQARLRGLVRSLVIYRRPGRQRRLRRMYAPLVRPGDLVFDIGAHLGDRTRAFASLGARVIALEPQPRLLAWLRRGPGRHERVRVRHEAVGAQPGLATLFLSHAHPTVSTLSGRWVQQLPEANPSFRAVRWDDRISVRQITLDELIAEHGRPDFCKIDVEGFELEVLGGLTTPIPALSLEFVAGALDIPRDCLQRLAELGDYEYNVVAGEQRHFRFAPWQDAATLLAWLEQHAERIGSGDLYARLRP